MKIGVFDSGLGGLMIARAIKRHMPGYDMVYLGDTLHVPYGKRSQEAIYTYTKNAVEFLFRQDCQLIILACNTASAAALRRLQQEYLPKAYPERRILGVVVPTLETCVDEGHKNIGLIATEYTIQSDIYAQELQKINPAIKLTSQATPLLVPLIEHKGMKWMEMILRDYMRPLIEADIEACVLGCTHYVYIKDMIQQVCGDHVKVISQDEIIPLKLADYLQRHSEMDLLLGKSGSLEFYITDKTADYKDTTKTLYDADVDVQLVNL